MNEANSENITLKIKEKLFRCTSESRKGEMGTILIIGGSNLYCGAPYFTSLGAFYTGSELVYVFSEQGAINPLKALLPEAIVTQIDKIDWILNKVTACVLGPGLGRPSKIVLERINEILNYLNKKNVPLIIDGDGIAMVKSLEIKTHKTVIFTPNLNEQKYLDLNNNYYYVKKGPIDIISKGSDIVAKIKDEGCLKRIGGQGDILVGIIASLISQISDNSNENIPVLLEFSCKILRNASKLAYDAHWKSIITRDILECLKTSYKSFLEK